MEPKRVSHPQMERKRVWRPLNTVGLILIGSAVGFVCIYTILDLSRVCSAL